MQLTIKQAAARWGVDYITARSVLLLLERQRQAVRSKLKRPGVKGRATYVYTLSNDGCVNLVLDGRQTF